MQTNKIKNMKTEDLDFSGIFDIENQKIEEYTEEDAILERTMMLDSCCTCKNFKHYYASAGVCLLDNTSDCKITRFVDYDGPKCQKWEVCDEEKDFFESLK